MLEDDIEYLGTNTLSRVLPSNGPFLNQRPSIGVTLHVQPSDDQPASDIAFYKSQTAVVNIGRKPGSDTDQKPGETESNTAMFRCPVISRRHARIAFSDSGQVYLIDLSSHHGTHILKRGETVSTAIKPEVPVLLADGDTVTFGKSVNVGKGDEKQLVRPVTVRVQLLHEVPSGPPNPHSVLHLLSQSVMQGVDLQECLADQGYSPKTSGRYGLYPSSTSSSDESSSEFDHDSDIEEIAPPSQPEPKRQPEPPQSTSSAPNFSGLFGFSSMSSFDVLKRLLPPSHKPTTPPPVPSPSRPSAAHSNRSSPPPFDFPLSFSPQSPMINFISPRFSPMRFDLYGHDADVTNLDEDDEEGEEEEGRGRTTSPMDLSSPSPVPGRSSWPASRSLSSVSSPLLTPPQAKKLLGPGEALSEDPTAAAEDLAIINRSGGGDAARKSQGDVSKEGTSGGGKADANTQKGIDMAEVKTKELNAILERIRVDLDKLQAHKRKYKSRFNQNVHTIAEKLSNLEDQQTTLSDQLDTLINVDVPDIQGQVDELQDMVDALGPIVKEGVADALGERDDVKEGVATMKALVEEMKKLRDNAEKEIAAEIEAVKTVRSTAVATLKAEAQIPSSLKRKRSLSEDECFNCSDGGESTSNAEVQTTHSTLTLKEEGVEVPKPKRARKILSVVVQTTTAVTIGAAITWSALAFS